MRSCLQIIIISLTLARTLFSYVFLGRLGWSLVTSAVASRDRGSIPRESSSSEATLDVLVGSGRSKIVEIASRLSFFCQDIPIVGLIAYAGWKESSLKCLSHKKLCLDGPFQRSRVCSVLLTCRIHCSLRRSSLGNYKKLTVSRQVLLHHAATQFITILSTISLFLRDGRKQAAFL